MYLSRFSGHSSDSENRIGSTTMGDRVLVKPVISIPGIIGAGIGSLKVLNLNTFNLANYGYNSSNFRLLDFPMVLRRSYFMDFTADSHKPPKFVARAGMVVQLIRKSRTVRQQLHGFRGLVI